MQLGSVGVPVVAAAKRFTKLQFEDFALQCIKSSDPAMRDLLGKLHEQLITHGRTEAPSW